MSTPSAFSDPAVIDGMMAGMKTQMVMMVPQMVIMGWINFFFQGFVLSASLLVWCLRVTQIFQSNCPFP